MCGAILAGTMAGATAPAALRIANGTAPAGGWAQIRMYAVQPMPLASGRLVLSLDSSVFGPGASAGLFGANGDASGLAIATGLQVDVQFASPSGGIGQLAGLPVMVVSAPVLASAAGKTVTVSATSPDGTVTVASGAITVQGTLSVEKIPAGVGVIPAGTIVPVFGSGFTAATKVTIDGVAIASTQFVSAAEIDVTLGGAAELVGKLARVTDGESEFDYFCFATGDPVNSPGDIHLPWPLANVQPLFPLLGSSGWAYFSGYIGGAVEVENPNTAQAVVTVTNVLGISGAQESSETLAIPPGGWAAFSGGVRADSMVSANLPVRAVALNDECPSGSTAPCLAQPGPIDATTALQPPTLAPAALAFTWQRGAAALPAARSIAVSGRVTSAPVAATVTAGSDWLSIANATNASFSVPVDPSRLGAGRYTGTIGVQQGYGQAATLPVSLTVTDAAVPTISAAPASLNFSATTFTSTPYSETLTISSDSGAAPFSVLVPQGSWLKVSPLSGTTPATLTVSWDPAVTAQIYYQQRSTPSTVTISGPGNAMTVPATFNVTGVQTFQTFLGASGTGPGGLVFSAQTGTAPPSQTINVDPAGTIAASADQPWIRTSAPATGANQMVTVTVDPSGLSPGVYHGTVTIGEEGLAPIAVPVTLGVWSSAPQLTISQSSFTFVQTIGGAAPAFQAAKVDSGGVPVPFHILLGADWLWVVDSYNAPTPASIQVVVTATPVSPGQYDGSFTLQSAGGSVYVPVTLLVEPGTVAPPVVSQVVNAASGMAGAIAPGEIVSIRGYGVGASSPSGKRLDPAGVPVSQLNGLQVTFDGRPAPLLYTSANQTNVTVPDSVAGQTSTAMQVVYAAAAGTLKTAAWALPVAPAAPGIFTMDATGRERS